MPKDTYVCILGKTSSFLMFLNIFLKLIFIHDLNDWSKRKKVIVGRMLRKKAAKGCGRRLRTVCQKGVKNKKNAWVWHLYFLKVQTLRLIIKTSKVTIFSRILPKRSSSTQHCSLITQPFKRPNSGNCRYTFIKMCKLSFKLQIWLLY